MASALALRQQLTVHGDVLERVEVFKYLGRLLSQDDNDIGKPAPPGPASGKFSEARMHRLLPPPAILLYGSESWVLSPTAMARLEGFHIRCAYRMAKEHKPK